jgi:multiple sugar transport system permease protein
VVSRKVRSARRGASAESPVADRDLVEAAAPPPRLVRRRLAQGSPARANGWPFVIPAILLLLLLNIFPLVFSVVMSFSNVSTDNGLHLESATLANWGQLLHNGDFWASMKFTVFLVVVAVAGEFVIGLGMALLLWRKIPGGGFFRVLFSIPMMLAPVAVGFMFRMLFNEQYGPIDSVLKSIGLPKVLWLSDTTTAPFSVVVMDIWQWTPLMFLLLLAGLQAMPEDAIEAARIDGASGARVLWDVILPMLAPISVMAVFLRMVLAFTIFGEIYLLTGGGPGTSTTSTTLLAYFQGFQTFNISYGSTISLALLIFVTGIAVLYLSVTRVLLHRVRT